MQQTPRSRARYTGLASAASGIAVSTVVAALLLLTSVTVPVTPARAADGSAQTVTAASQDADIADAPLPKLAVTVSQTTDLISQGLSISWTGGLPSTVPAGDTGGANFLQVMQCWGDDPSVPAGKPAQPDRTTCQYGAFLTAGATRDNFVTDGEVAPQDAAYTAPSTGFANPTYTSIPFRSPAGDVVASVVNNRKISGVNVNTNKFFTPYTSNEVKWAGSASDGTGSIKFEVQTAQQSSGLSCGTPIPASDGTVSGTPCWLVVIPRGNADVGESYVTHSGLFWDAWKHHIAIRTGFKPLGIHCPIGGAERQISGSELIAGAVASWQPALCAGAGGSPFTISTGAESDALLSASSATVPAALALTSRPLDTSGGGVDPNVYAPVALSGISIAFAIDRHPISVGDVPKKVIDANHQAFTSINLTPRLIAKLLTNSYLDSLPGDKSDVGYVSVKNRGSNKRNLTTDPDFLAVNDPEWAFEALVSPSLADMVTPQGRSDVAWQLWRYVLADPLAADFLAGKPDPWGMIVNPWNSTVAAKNPSDTALTLPRDSFPKSDPTELAADPNGAGPINLVAWRPYTNDLDQGGYLTLRGDGLVLGPWDQTKTPPQYTKAVRSLSGFQTVIGLTDTASAAKYQVVSASLLNPAGQFVAPTAQSMSAAAAAMIPTATQKQVLEYNPSSASAAAAPTAYPLTMPVYAATNPAQGDHASRQSDATFVRYAATSGQKVGTAPGQLPPGYAPLPAGWVTQALASAALITAGAPTVLAPAPTAAAEAPVAPNPPSFVQPPVVSSGNSDTPTVAATTDPTAKGTVSAPLLGAATPADSVSKELGSVVPTSLFAGLLSAGVIPFITRIRRRR